MEQKWTKMNHLLLYGTYEQAFRLMPAAEVGRLVIGMLHYLNTGEEYVPKDKSQYIWVLIKDQIDRNIEKYEKVCERNRNNAQKFWDSRRAEGEDATGTDPEP